VSGTLAVQGGQPAGAQRLPARWLRRIAFYLPAIVVFVVTIAVWEVLVSNIQIHHGNREPARQAAREGLTSAARITTAACLIMTSVFASFILTGDPTIKPSGVGIATAVLLAAILVVT